MPTEALTIFLINVEESSPAKKERHPKLPRWFVSLYNISPSNYKIFYAFTGNLVTSSKSAYVLVN